MGKGGKDAWWVQTAGARAIDVGGSKDSAVRGKFGMGARGDER